MAEPLSLVTTVFGPVLHGRDVQPPLCRLRQGGCRYSERLPRPVLEGFGPVGSVNAGTTSSSNALAVDRSVPNHLYGYGFDLRLVPEKPENPLRMNTLRTS